MADLVGEDRTPTTGSVKTPRWGRKILTGMIAMAAMGGFAMIVVFSYNKGQEKAAQAGTPIIVAAKGPTKIKPEDPGGMPIRDQDKGVYDRLDPTATKEKVENLLPAPEPVMAKPEPEPLKKLTETEVKKVAELAPASGQILTDAPPPPPPIIAEPAKPVAKPQITEEPAKSAEVARDAIKEPIVVAKTEPEQIIKKPAIMPKKTAINKNGYRIQIASLRSKQAANAAWRKLQKKHPALFSKLSPKIVQAKINGKGTYYRLQAGILNGPSEAKALCSKAKKRRIGCLIVKPR
ncbi:MAG: hypothetical protein CMM52_08555 [Rhodospirillaceae bacterium]|nr:hypothetical protein [Rhodospirillaceae bacterium]|tara:strand:+ start:22798 stop:23673 length:876 start_codon:yes stop_codon:yes gene_type:complete